MKGIFKTKTIVATNETAHYRLKQGNEIIFQFK